MNQSETLERLLRIGRKLLPRSVFGFFQPAYHFILAFTGALVYGFPSKELVVIGVTGTKGKSTTVELVNAILEEADLKTAVAGTIRFKIGDESWPNLYKMTMPGRFFLQKFLRRAVDEGCTHAVIEMTSEGSRLFRYRFVSPDALIFTNLAPEHIESHGSYEAYANAKVNIAKRVLKSGKERRILVVNADDKEAARFISLGIPETYKYSLEAARPYEAVDDGISFTFEGMLLKSPLRGTFNIYNALAAATLARAIGIRLGEVIGGITRLGEVAGRAQFIRTPTQSSLASKQDFDVVVDYAHTSDSLEAIYGAFPSRRKICVLGSTGGGRDKWKRKEMGKVASAHCDEIILTNEDPYDEDPEEIIKGVADGIANKPHQVILDRRVAIRKAIDMARTGDAVLITGKGTDPYIMEADGQKTPWSDAAVATEELEKSLLGRSAAK